MKRKSPTSRTAKMTPLKEAIDAILQNFEKKGGEKFVQGKIKSVWGEIMGEVITAQTTEFILKNGCLYIRITSASLKNDLSMSKERIKTKLNTKLGKKHINEIRFL